MDFKEFFKKKRIDLETLEKAEPALFSEFKYHFEQMGEKSFDHTKKYWFNKLRRQFPLAAGIKTEKPLIANPLAEQTIIESLTEPIPTSSLPKIGFVPRFKAAGIQKSIVKDEQQETLPAVNETEKVTGENEEIKTGYVPKFKMKPETDTGPAS